MWKKHGKLVRAQMETLFSPTTNNGKNRLKNESIADQAANWCARAGEHV